MHVIYSERLELHIAMSHLHVAMISISLHFISPSGIMGAVGYNRLSMCTEVSDRDYLSWEHRKRKPVQSLSYRIVKLTIPDVRTFCSGNPAFRDYFSRYRGVSCVVIHVLHFFGYVRPADTVPSPPAMAIGISAVSL